MRIGVVGATGAVGREILNVLARSALPIQEIRCFASERSLGTLIPFPSHTLFVESLSSTSFELLDVVFFAAGKEISLRYVPEAVKASCLVIDASSAFRMHPDVPLVIPEINGAAATFHQGIIASPNCSTTMMLMAVAPLHRVAQVKRIVVCTYQAASGAGAIAMEELKEETKAYLEGNPSFTRTIIPHPYAFNLFPHNSSMTPSGYVEEELKMMYESRKILADETLKIHATCVRVPVLRAHSEAINVTFHEPLSPQDAYAILKQTPGIAVVENWETNRFPMPIDATGQDLVLCGRIRADLSEPNTLDLWVVGDQLLKGAALNAVQIVESLYHWFGRDAVKLISSRVTG